MVRRLPLFQWSTSREALFPHVLQHDFLFRLLLYCLLSIVLGVELELCRARQMSLVTQMGALDIGRPASNGLGFVIHPSM